jgi:DNA-binding beta-propeller fold protein YncE
LAVALGIGTAVITPGIAWADGAGESTENSAGPGSGGDTNPGGGTTTATTTTTTTDGGDNQNNHDDNATNGDDNQTGGNGTTTVQVGDSPAVTFETGATRPTKTETAEPSPTAAPTSDPAYPLHPTPTSSVVITNTPAPTSTATPTPVATLTGGGAIVTGTPIPAANPTGTPLTLTNTTSTNISTPPTTSQQTPSFARLAAPNTAVVVDPTAPYALPDPPTVTTPPVDPIGALFALPGNILSFATDLISAALTPFVTGVPSTPADTPVLWAVLAFVRRQFFNSTPTLAPNGQVAYPTTGQLYGLVGGVDADGDPLTYEVLQGPAHGDITLNAVGAYVYTPDAGYVGEDSFTVGVSDTGAHVHGLAGLFSPYGPHTTVATIGLTAVPVVTAANTAPTITAAPGDTDSVTGAIRYTVTTHDTPGDTVTVSVTTSPENGTLTRDDTDPAVYVYTPDPVYAHGLALGGATAAGSDTITFTATDSKGLTGSVTVTPAVAPVNATPTLHVITTPIPNEANGAVLVTVTLADADSDDVTLNLAAPTHGYYTNDVGGTPFPDGGFTGTLSTDPIGKSISVVYVPDRATPGTETLTFTVTDSSGATNSTTTQVVVTAPANGAPAVQIHAADPAADGSVLIGVVVSDPEGDPVAVTPPVTTTGSISYLGSQANANGSTTFGYLYTPSTETRNAAYATGGPDSVTLAFNVTDGQHEAASYGVSAPISPLAPVVVNHPPTITVVPTTNVNGSVNLAITIADPDADVVTLALPTPTHGSFVGVPGGTVTPGIHTTAAGETQTLVYQPDRTNPGVENLTFTLTDSGGKTATTTTQITVDPVVNHPPTITVVPTTNANGTTSLVVTIADIDSDTVAVEVGHLEHGYYTDGIHDAALPDGLVISGISAGPVGLPATFVYVPDHTKPGVENATFTITDSSGQTATATTQITVAAVDTAPTINVVPTTNADGTVSLAVTIADQDDAAVTLTLGQREHGSLSVDGQSLPDTVTGGPVPLPSGTLSIPFVYTPDPSRPGVETLRFTVTDPSGQTATYTKQITVVAVSTAPTINVVPTTNAEGTVSLAVTIADPDDAAVTLTLGQREHGSLSIDGQSLPDTFTGGPVQLPSGTLSIPFVYTPDPSRPGVETLRFTVTDPSGQTATYIRQILVGPAIGTPTLLLGNPFAPVDDIAHYDLAVVGDRIYVTTYQSTVAVIDRNTGQLIGTPVSIPNLPRSGVAVTPDGKLALITTDDDNGGPQGVQIVNLQTGATKFVETGDGPQWVTVNAAGTRAYVSNTFDGSVTVIDISATTPTKLFDITGVVGPEGAVAVGNRVYVTSYDDESVLVYDANSAGDALAEYQVGSPAWGIDAAPDGRLVVTTDDSIAVIDPSDGSVQSIGIPAGWVAGYGVAVSPDGKLAYATGALYDADDNFVESGVFVIDLTTNAFAGDPVVLGTADVWGVRVSPDGKTIYVLQSDGTIAPLTLIDPTVV